MSHSADHGHGHASEGASPESVAAGYELVDVRVRPLVLATVGVFVVILLTYVLIWGLLFVGGGGLGDASHALPSADEAQSQLPPEPRLEQNPTVDGDRMIATAVEQLETYGWVNQRQGVAHIPIERAKELLLEQGVNPFGNGQ